MDGATDPLIGQRAAIVGPTQVLTGDADTARYGADWRRSFPGAARAAFLQHKPALAVELMTRIKRAFDPAGLFNPGRVLPR